MAEFANGGRSIPARRSWASTSPFAAASDVGPAVVGDSSSAMTLACSSTLRMIVILPGSAEGTTQGLNLSSSPQEIYPTSDRWNSRYLRYGRCGVGGVNAVSYTHLTLPTKRI